MAATRIVIFAKAPVAGQVKTRLVPALGAEKAARLAVRMLAHTAAQALAADVGVVELCATPPPDASAWEGLRPAGVQAMDQGEGDLGERLARAARRVIDGGEQVLLIGSDCPALGADRLRHAARQLQAHPAVMHPARDGGYALLGLSRFDRSLFENIRWSTDTVAADTLARLGTLGWPVYLGTTLRDVDEAGDLDEVPAGWLA